MTPRQINKAVGNYRALLEKYSGYFPSDTVQAVLGNSDFAAAQFNLFRERVEAQSGLLIREVVVDLSLIGMAAIDATKSIKYIIESVVTSMPRATAATNRLHFFQTGRYTSVAELEAEADKRGLTLVDPHTLAAFNAANPEFADTRPNVTQWKDQKGNFCYALFYGSRGERRVRVYRHDHGWDHGWWFAGVSK